ncbi:MAG TPA: DUF1501 domain-containing protein, partial [Planctomycetaceae bacterium]|nr:DUF1501 domain-containing protein [Planctomycetaceae bacterium]
MKSLLRKADERTRREVLASIARAALGVSVVPFANELMNAPAMAGTASAPGKAEHVIYLFMNGAMSHIDTFDPKPDKEEGGETKAIATSVPGISIGHHLPLIAKQMNRIALIRSMTTETGAHEPGTYLMRTSFKQIGSIRHPFMGSWLTHVSGKLNKDLPGSVIVGAANRHPGQGYLPADTSPAPVGDPKVGLQNTAPPKYLKEDDFKTRQRLIARFDAGFKNKYQSTDIEAYVDYYREAVRLLQSPDLVAFDINKEDESVRTAYGSHRIGQGCLLARRLVEKKVRFVEVEFGGWDNHNDIYGPTNLTEKAAQLDQALSALLDDLQSKGLLSKTLVVLGTEFGRTPKINQNAGRDHHPGAFSCLLAGAGIKGGQVVGHTDTTGRSVEDGHCLPHDLNATIAAACGLPLDKEFISPSGRPFHIADKGTPVSSVLG